MIIKRESITVDFQLEEGSDEPVFTMLKNTNEKPYILFNSVDITLDRDSLIQLIEFLNKYDAN